MYERRIKLLCAACFIFGISVALLFVSGAGIVFFHHYHFAGSEASARTRFEPGSPSNHTGPWGNLDAVEIPLANPDGSFPDQEQLLERPRWFFERFSENSLTRFLSSCDLRSAERRVLLDK